ncbi:MAG: thioredoxin family protein [Planctomycetota bacterium]
MSSRFSGLSFLCTIVALTIAVSSAPADEIPWSTNLDASLQQARTSGKPVLMEFTASWCVYCKRMEKTTFTDPQVAQLIREGFVAVRVDADQNKALVTDLQIKGLPAILVVTADLQIIERISGFQTPEVLLPKLQNVLRRSMAPTQTPTMAASQANQPASPKTVAVTKKAELEFEAISHDEARPSQRNSVKAVSKPRSVSRPEPAREVASQDDTHQFFEQLEAEKSQKTAPTDAGPGTKTPADASSAAVFRGYCLVSAVEDRELIPGSPRVQLDYRGHVLYFRSEDDKQRFIAEPARYWPMLDGTCAMTLLDDDESVEGDLEYAAMFRRRIWLFSSEQKMKEFLRDPADVVEALANAQESAEE